MKWVLWTVMALVLITSTWACKDTYDLDERIIIIDVIESSGENASCTITIYNGNSTIDTVNMSRAGLVYTYNGSSLDAGVYTSDISCTHNSSLYQSECKFNVEGIKMLWIIGVALAVALAIFFAGMRVEDENLVGFAGLLFMTIGVFVLINGIDGYDNLVTLVLGITTVGVGAYVFIRVYLELIIEGLDKLKVS